MKKNILIISFTVMISFMSICHAKASSLSEGISSLFINSNEETMEVLNSKWNEVLENYYPPDANYLKYKYPTYWESVVQGYINTYQERAQVDWDKVIKYYYIEKTDYLLQYVQNDCLNYLGNAQYWFLPSQSALMTSQGLSDEFYEMVTYDMNCNQVTEGFMTKQIMDEAAYEYLNNIEDIEDEIDKLGASNFLDAAIVSLEQQNTLLYLRYSNKNFAVLIYEAPNKNIPKPDIEKFKVYEADELVHLIGLRGYYQTGSLLTTSQMLDIKPIYNTEAEELQGAGLLQGNENGLDLLKPLTRAEAVTLLVRALGLESETANYAVSEFADITNDNWAAPYAALAKSRGIANGISETEFAPDERVTSDQFAAFALRAIGESDFDYTEGTEILINKGIITEEQADTMDLFTRGDMAKIIYEMREMGLMQQ